MENAEKAQNWIPTSFATTSASDIGEGDSVSSFQSVTTPGSTAVDQQSCEQFNDQSQDVSIPKPVVNSEEQKEKTSVEGPSAINVFEEDARSSWSEEPKQTQQTEFKETALDECSRNSASSQKNTKETAPDESSRNSASSPKSTKETAVDESSRNSASSQKSTKGTAVDESSRTSVSSQKSTAKKPCTDEVEKEETKREFPPENLFEYMWPQENGEFYILQEQICNYLNVKSFKRKYPDLTRRTLDISEKKFLREKGIVTEMQCDLGLTALKSEEVLELMSKDYPDLYKEYIKVLRDKEQQSITEKHKDFAATNSDKSKMVDLVKKAVQSAAEYNAHLNQERREERKSCMDLQTFTIHYPVKTNKIKKYTKPGKYPVALLPGQFQDYYKKYTADELKYLPVNSVLYGPLKELNSLKALSDGSQSDSDESSASEESCCSSSQETHDDSSSGSEKTDSNKKGTGPNSPYRPKIKPNAICKVCKTGSEGKVKDGKPEELVHCADCENSAHPSCIDLTSDVVNVLKTYPWQCTDCKVCSYCKDPNDEAKMLFCDICDRGYHTFCVGLKGLPQGKWICRQCGACSVCGTNQPAPDSSKVQWFYDTTKGNDTDIKSCQPNLLCLSCFKKKR